MFKAKKVDYGEVCQWVGNATCSVDQNETVIKHLLSIIDKSESELILTQQKVVKLQNELLEKTNVTSTVHDTVKQGFRSFNEVLKSAPKNSALCEEKLKAVVKTAVEEEDRSKNLIIHDLHEDYAEQLPQKVSRILKSCVGAPKP